MKKMSINKHSLVILFFLIPCLVPAGLLNEGVSKTVFNLWRIIAFIMILPQGLFLTKKRSEILIYSSLFSIVMIVSTYMNNGVIESAISIAMLIFTSIVLTEREATRNMNLYIKICKRMCMFILAVDTFQVYTGIGVTLGNTTIMGGDNFAVFSIIPMLGIIVLGEMLLYSKVRKGIFLFCLVVAGAKFMTFAVTSIIAFLILGLLLMSIKYIETDKRMIAVIRVVIVLLTLMLIFNFENAFLLLSKIVGKGTVAEHSRIGIWHASIQAIVHKPWFGHGVLTVENEEIALIGSVWPTYSHTHNIVLEILFRSGIIGLFMYLMTFKKAFILIVKDSNDLLKKIVRAFFIAYFLLGITDSYYEQAPIYILLALVPYIFKKKNGGEFA